MRLGADPDGLERLADLHRRIADDIAATVHELRRSTLDATWHGARREQVVRCLTTTAPAVVNRLVVGLRGFAARLDAAAGAQRATSRVLDPTPPRALSFDPHGDGMAVVSVGDLSRARHVAIVVPGIGTTVDDLDELIITARSVQDAAIARARTGDEVAVVAWLGYDTPGGLDDPAHLTDALLGRSARSGAARLRRFVATLDLDPGTDVSLVGHSYGSLVVALAAERDPRVDRVVVLGSPGLLVDHAADLRLASTTELVAAAAPGDLVARSEWFGDAPTDDGFGATVIDAGPWPGQPPAGIGRAHSSYFVDGSQALDNLALVVAGRRARPPVSERPAPPQRRGRR